MDPNLPGRLVVSTLDRWWPGDEIYRSEDGGQTWMGVLDGAALDHSSAPWAATLSPHWISDVEIDPFDSGRASFITGYGIFLTATTRLQSHNFPIRYIRHFGYRGRIDANVSPIENSQFRVRVGLTNAAGVSFESVNYAGYYLRVRTNGEVWVDKNDGTTAFKDSATFERVPGLADSSESSFRMWTDSTRYLRHYACWLYAQSGSGSAFNGDATFAEIQP